MHASRIRRTTIASTAAAALLLAAGSASAALLRVDFTGSISLGGSFDDPTGLFAQGDPLSGFWLVETTTADTAPAADTGLYPQTGAPAFQFDIGGHLFSSTSTTIQILNDATIVGTTGDAYDVLSAPSSISTSIAGLAVNTLQITLRDLQPPTDVFASDALPAGAPDPGDFDQFGQVQAQITGNLNGASFFMNLDIDGTTASRVAVSEPATALLLGALPLVMLGRRRRSYPAVTT